MEPSQSVTLKQLRALSAVARGGSVAAAAELLHVTGPAVSIQLRTLEAHVGGAVLRRGGGGGRAEPTALGREVLAAAAQVDSVLELCFRKLAAIRAGQEGHVALGVVSTGKYFAPRLVAMIRDAMPKVHVGLLVGNRGEVIEALAARRIELAIMGRPPREPAVEADLLGDHPHIVVAPPNHPLARGQAAAAEALLGETFLGRERGSGTRILMERFLDRIGGGRPWDVLELGSNETIKQAVMAGLGLALISAHTVEAELQSGRLASLPLPGLPIVRQWFLVRRADAPLAPATERLRGFVLSRGGAYLPAGPQGG